MLANLSTPLLGIVDTAVVGQLPDPVYVGAVAVGALVFSVLFWAFGFLRMGTTGLTAQALGAANDTELVAGLLRALCVAALAGGMLVLAQWPLSVLAWRTLDVPVRVEALAADYFSIRIWAAPATLANYALIGWFVGLGRTRRALVVQLMLNLTNIVLDAWLVLVLDMGVAGVALGSVLAELTALCLGLALALPALRAADMAGIRANLRDLTALRRMLAINCDIMIRSLALILAFGWFTAQGARMGTVVLAANAVLMQLVSFGAYFLDGLAHAAESLVGRAIGAVRADALRLAVTRTTRLAALLAALLSGLLWFGGPVAVALMTVDPETRVMASAFLPWAAATPLLGVWAFQLDGIFIGATRGRAMRNAMLLSLLVYFLAWWLLRAWGNHGLWAALALFYLARAATLAVALPHLLAGKGQATNQAD